MNTYPDTKKTLQIIKELVEIPSPSGNTNKIMSFVEEYLSDLNVELKRNRKGALIITIPGEDSGRHRMLTAHVDALGAMVKEIKSDGRLRLSMIVHQAANLLGPIRLPLHLISLAGWLFQEARFTTSSSFTVS